MALALTAPAAMMKDPSLIPPLVGVNLTLIVQVVAGAIGAVMQLSVSEKSPCGVILVTTNGALPVLVNITV
jgi:hypothetical protein